jgi:ubiquinone/menaquinone biosynthesis C-methylase UbiE
MFRDITAPYHAIESWIYDRIAAPAVTEMIEKHLDLRGPFLEAMPEQGRLLDVGCGGGQLAIALARRHPGWRVTGLDLSRDQVRRAELRGRVLGGQALFLRGSAMEIPLEQDAFDGLISVCSIKHWPDPGKGLTECLRVLRPGGSLVVMEVDPDYHPEDGRSFVARQRVPSWLRPVAMAGFKWKIAARSLMMDEALALFSGLPAEGVTAGKPAGMPLWMITARKGRAGVITPGDSI